MAGITNIAWEIIIPEGIDWLEISPLRGTGYTRVNVKIVNGSNSSTSTTVTVRSTNLDGRVEETYFEVIKCITCDCSDLDVVQIFPCDCSDLTIEPIQCSCGDIEISVESLSFGYNEQGAKSVSVTDTCSLPIDYVPVPNGNFIHVSKTQNGIDVTVDANPNNSSRSGSIEIQFNGTKCHTITVNQDGKPCDCNNLTLRQK